MKYIRTKDGKILPTLWQDTSTAIKEANTIEELCDKFVIEYDSGYHTTWVKLKNALEMAKMQKKLGFAIKNIFGAIWIKLPNDAPRLEPVAKLNDKGELELL